MREKNGQLQPERPVYRVTLKATGTDDPHGSNAAARHTWRGTVTIAGRPEVPAWRYSTSLTTPRCAWQTREQRFTPCR